MAVRAVDTKKKPNGDGSVYFNQTTNRWSAKATIIDETGKKVRKTWYGKTREEAKAKMDDARAAIRKGDFSGFRQTPTVEDWCRRWIESIHIRPTSLEKYRQAIETHIIPMLGTDRLSELVPSRINVFETRLFQKGLAPATVHRIKGTLGQALAAAVQDGIIVRNAVAQSRKTKRNYEEKTILTPDQQKKLFAVEADANDLDLWRLLSQTGMRIAEAQGLKWSDLDFEAGTIRIQRQLSRVGTSWIVQIPKTTRSRRTIPMSADVRKVLVTRPIKYQGEYLFEPIVPATMVNRLYKALKKAGLPHYGFHVFRHSYASMLLAKGVPLPEVSALLGHSSTAITAQIYSHFLDKNSTRGADVMDSIFSED